jgi:hypothetical protein
VLTFLGGMSYGSMLKEDQRGSCGGDGCVDVDGGGRAFEEGAGYLAKGP